MPESEAIQATEEEPGEWWDVLAEEARSPWNSRAFARLQRECGARTRFLSATRGGAPAGCLAIWFAGSRRMPLLDPIFVRTARIPDEPAVPSGDRSVALALARAADEEIRRLGAVESVWRVELPRLLATEDLAALGYRTGSRGFGVLELSRDGAELEERLAKTARKQVRKARREGVRVEVAGDVERLLPLLDLSFARSGLPPRDHGYVRALHRCLGGEVLVALQGDRPLAALLWARVGRVALNVFHGRADGEILGASNLLHLEMFSRCAALGVELVHTGDAGLPGESNVRVRGISHFKETMGFEIRPAFQGEKAVRPFAARLRRATLGAWVRATAGEEGAV